MANAIGPCEGGPWPAVWLDLWPDLGQGKGPLKKLELDPDFMLFRACKNGPKKGKIGLGLGLNQNN